MPEVDLTGRPESRQIDLPDFVSKYEAVERADFGYTIILDKVLPIRWRSPCVPSPSIKLGGEAHVSPRHQLD
ncbi:hypothetical protein [Fundicoccus culcitae]|uniref:Uncharacterized protein n=1 Tax=Fundicoccus culcitae TaxID=2969821 RepID=A0ABY5P429_9LACT|nr:hypothetical protein [Fundicoccus culcitae]UUX33245.1 hypothetical protein NRE15_10060 [Fundicoccus culcitae]